MRSKDYISVMQKFLHLLDEGIHVVDESGTSIIYNESMACLEKMKVHDVLDKPFNEVFKNLDENDSTLIKALRYNLSTTKKVQTYYNKYGKEITTINTTVPIVVDNEVIAAVEVAKNITDIKEMSNTILDLQTEIAKPDVVKKNKINKYNFRNLIGKNENFIKIIEYARKAAMTDASVFIYGETGTGKELIAQSIHFDGIRHKKHFLAQNCAALPEALLEGILFGTSKGGFTGAIDRPGLFEQANGGTLLLDEINSMAVDLQAKLLRVLQENYIRRVGGTKDIPIDVRIIATVNEDPHELIEKGLLRKDLYYRLNIISLNLPPLRERREDILLLSDKFLYKYNKRYKKEIIKLSEKAKQKLISYDFPGNVRELENIIISAVAMADDEKIISDKHILIKNVNYMHTCDFGNKGISAYLNKIEREIIVKTMNIYDNNISKAAEHMKIKRQTLQHKLKKYNINVNKCK